MVRICALFNSLFILFTLIIIIHSDERGRWKTLRGYWDENFEWVDMSHGYYNEKGEFVLHHVSGDLDFMV